MNIPCVKCKGVDRLCGRAFCPIYAKAESLFKVEKNLGKENFFGASPAPFIGRFDYPNVNVGILSPPEIKEDVWLYDSPQFWANQNFSIPQVIDLRSSLVNSRIKSNIKDHNKILEIGQEIGMSSRPVDVEINLEQRPRFRINNDALLAPTGPNARLKNVRITENPKIHKKVDKVVSDTDLKANDAILDLYGSGFDENFLSKLLSVGTVGLKYNRKLVPTRWSITATDDLISKSLIDEIKQFSESDYQAFFGSYLGNYYLIMLFPEPWGFELFETYLPKASFNISDEIQYTTDYESYDGRKCYAENCGGGYYACKLPVLEKLKNLKRQASVLVIRMITGEYAVPLGVWVCREATRKSLSSKPIGFSDKSLMLNYAKILVKKKFGHDISNILEESILLRNLKNQKKLASFFSA